MRNRSRNRKQPDPNELAAQLYLVGGRDAGWAAAFMQDVANRIKGRIQLTTDGHRVYVDAVEDAFGADIDYAMLQKVYGAMPETETRYSPAQCIGCERKVIAGRPDYTITSQRRLWRGAT